MLDKTQSEIPYGHADDASEGARFCSGYITNQCQHHCGMQELACACSMSDVLFWTSACASCCASSAASSSRCTFSCSALLASSFCKKTFPHHTLDLCISLQAPMAIHSSGKDERSPGCVHINMVIQQLALQR